MALLVANEKLFRQPSVRDADDTFTQDSTSRMRQKRNMVELFPQTSQKLLSGPVRRVEDEATLTSPGHSRKSRRSSTRRAASLTDLPTLPCRSGRSVWEENEPRPRRADAISTRTQSLGRMSSSEQGERGSWRDQALTSLKRAQETLWTVCPKPTVLRRSASVATAQNNESCDIGETLLRSVGRSRSVAQIF